MIQRRIMPTEIPEVQQTRYMRSHNSGNIQGKNLHIVLRHSADFSGFANHRGTEGGRTLAGEV